MQPKPTNSEIISAVSKLGAAVTEIGEAVQTLAVQMDRRFDQQNGDIQGMTRQMATKDDLEGLATTQDLRDTETRLTEKIKESELEIRGEIQDVEDEFQTDFKKLKRRKVTA